MGGGFVIDEDETDQPAVVPDDTHEPHPFHSGAEIVARAAETGPRISDLILHNEPTWRTAARGDLAVNLKMVEC